ncbi:MAG: carbonate dehydratase [Mariprofundaceae bacterium]|nr:carbonate dehydratase [Mariprofundaceae bacterium]
MRKEIPMPDPHHLLENNEAWAKMRLQQDSDFFAHLATLKKPKYMWIGCSDSRVPANEMIGVEPGQVFVHRNVANQVQHTDLNCLSAVQYAVDILGVEHIIVTGHYDCGGVRAAMESQHFGIVDNWIRGIRDTYIDYASEMKACDAHKRLDMLCELNVKRQVDKLSHTRIVQNAWATGRKLSLHGWVYRLQEGLLRDLRVTKSCANDVPSIYRVAGVPDFPCNSED